MNTKKDMVDTSSISGMSGLSDMSDNDTRKEKERGRGMENMPVLTNLRDSRSKVKK